MLIHIVELLSRYENNSEFLSPPARKFRSIWDFRPATQHTMSSRGGRCWPTRLDLRRAMWYLMRFSTHPTLSFGFMCALSLSTDMSNNVSRHAITVLCCVSISRSWSHLCTLPLPWVIIVTQNPCDLLFSLSTLLMKISKCNLFLSNTYTSLQPPKNINLTCFIESQVDEGKVHD